MNYQDAFKTLPKNAVWSSTFGNPGEGGYCEFHRVPNGPRFKITNGPYTAHEPFDWQMAPVD